MLYFSHQILFDAFINKKRYRILELNPPDLDHKFISKLKLQHY